MRINRFVLDNNIWISYFITNNQQQIIDIIDLYEIAVFSSDELINEFTPVIPDVPKGTPVIPDVTRYSRCSEGHLEFR